MLQDQFCHLLLVRVLAKDRDQHSRAAFFHGAWDGESVQCTVLQEGFYGKGDVFAGHVVYVA